MSEQGGGSSVKSNFTISRLSSLSETELSPTVSKIVTHLVGKAVKKLTTTADGPCLPLGGADGGEGPSLISPSKSSGGGNTPPVDQTIEENEEAIMLESDVEEAVEFEPDVVDVDEAVESEPEPVVDEAVESEPETVVDEAVESEPEPVVDESVVLEPDENEAVELEPCVEEEADNLEPVMDEAVESEPVVDEDEAVELEPVTDEAIESEPVADEGVELEPNVDGDVVLQPDGDQAVDLEPSVDEVVESEPIVDEAMAFEPDENEAVESEPVADKAVADEAVDLEPSVDEAVESEPVVDDLDEATALEPDEAEAVELEPVEDEAVESEPVVDEGVESEPDIDQTVAFEPVFHTEIGSNRSLFEDNGSVENVESQSMMTSKQESIIDSDGFIMENTPPQESQSEDNLKEAVSTEQFDLQAPETYDARSQQLSLSPIVIFQPSSESTQVIIPVIPIPEESEVQFGPTESVVRRHTIGDAESEMVTGGLGLHRNNGSVELELIVPDNEIVQLEEEMGTGPAAENSRSSGGAGETPGRLDTIFGSTSRRSGGAPIGQSAVQSEAIWFQPISQDTETTSVSTAAQFMSLIDEMAKQIAEINIDGFSSYNSGGFLQETYKRFSDAAKAAATQINGNSNFRTEGGNEGSARLGDRLPQDVKDHVLRTLSEIKTQLDQVKAQLRK